MAALRETVASANRAAEEWRRIADERREEIERLRGQLAAVEERSQRVAHKKGWLARMLGGG